MPNATVKLVGTKIGAAAANGTAMAACNDNSIALPSDRGALEKSGANLMYEGARVKSWMLVSDVNPAGCSDEPNEDRFTRQECWNTQVDPCFDPRVFTIPCLTGNLKHKSMNAMRHLGFASISAETRVYEE